jgi:hypothetical protein
VGFVATAGIVVVAGFIFVVVVVVVVVVARADTAADLDVDKGVSLMLLPLPKPPGVPPGVADPLLMFVLCAEALFGT